MPEVVSLFSGCGGSSLGYKMAGFKILLANEFVKEAQITYHANFPNTKLLIDDIRTIDGYSILKMIQKHRYELELLDGSPPCNPFSTAGKGSKLWGKVKHYSDEKNQRTDDLYFEFIRILKQIMPKMFLTENVPALINGKNRGYFNEIFQAMKEAGYKVTCAIINASYFGVPQNRNRLFFMGVRDNFNVEPTFPDAQIDSRPITVREAFENVKNQEWELEEARAMNPSSKYWLKHIRQGQKGSQAHPEKSFHSLSRCNWNKPAPTIIGLSLNSQTNNKLSSLCHPDEDRYLTISELRRIASFPDDFILTGNFSQQWERIARAVPPLLMKTIALHIKKNILPRLNT